MSKTQGSKVYCYIAAKEKILALNFDSGIEEVQMQPTSNKLFIFIIEVHIPT